jgi:hypothetical protein
MKIKVLVVYLGRLPENFPLFLESCKNNTFIDWHIITDDQSEFNTYSNVYFHYCSFDQVIQKIQLSCGNDAICHTAYKLCDYKPFYNIIFKDILGTYDYWGHCDIDVIWGNLEKFILEPIQSGRFDKILKYGHLSLFRSGFDLLSYESADTRKPNFNFVKKNALNFGFDEMRGVNSLFKQHDLDIFDKQVMLDIVVPSFSSSINFYNIKNYDKQSFIWSASSGLFHIFVENNKVKKKEYAYVHFQKRQLDLDISSHEGITLKDSMLVNCSGEDEAIQWAKQHIGIYYVLDVLKMNFKQIKQSFLYKLKVLEYLYKRNN